jgi:tight adherence protein C
MNAEMLFSSLSAACLTGTAVLAIVMALRPNRAANDLEERLSGFVSDGAAKQRRAADTLQGTFIQRVIMPVGQQIVRRLGMLAPAGAVDSLNHQLTTAGGPFTLAALDFLGLRVLVAAGCGALGALLAGRMPLGPWGLLAVPGAAGLGYMLPELWLNSLISKRRGIIQLALPDALDMLTICVEAGLAFESGLQRVSHQWDGALSEEFARVVAEVRLGVPRAQALRRMAQRCDLNDITSFVAVLVQADAMGTSIANVLRSQSDQVRVLRRQRAEEQANKAPIKMMIPMVLFILPALFVVILGPALPRIMSAFGSAGGI